MGIVKKARKHYNSRYRKGVNKVMTETLNDLKGKPSNPREKGWWSRFVQRLIKSNQELAKSGCKP
jgi:hypothetical protein